MDEITQHDRKTVQYFKCEEIFEFPCIPFGVEAPKKGQKSEKIDFFSIFENL